MNSSIFVIGIVIYNHMIIIIVIIIITITALLAPPAAALQATVLGSRAPWHMSSSKNNKTT